MGGQIVLVAMIVDTEDEARARTILGEIASAAAVPAADVAWSPYPKLGPHSKISAIFRFPADGGQPLVDAIERFAGLMVAPEGLRKGYLNSFLEGDGVLFYNRIFDARMEAFLRPDILWLDLEAHTHPDRQAQLQARFPN